MRATSAAPWSSGGIASSTSSGYGAPADAVRSGAHFVATNLDPTYPAATGLLPGAGALVAAVRTAGGRAPEVAGKPEQAMVELVRSRYRDPVVMIGDRPSTDGAFAEALGVPFALVLSGVAGNGGEEAVPDPRPAFVADDLGALAPSSSTRSGARLSSRRPRTAARRGEAHRPREDEGDEHAEHEAADVRERRDAARRLREELEHEPQPEHDGGRQPDRPRRPRRSGRA